MLFAEQYLPEDIASAVRESEDEITEIRIRAGRQSALTLSGGRGNRLVASPVPEQTLRRMLARMMEFSIYAWEDELCRGFFTLADGSRVGVAGRCIIKNGAISKMGEIGSVCIRIAREVRGAGRQLFRLMRDCSGESVLVLSPPGRGKTTLLRDGARLLSEAGWNIGIADERSEIAACRRGIPSLDVGPRTDVLDGCPKEIAIPMLIRSMSPDVILTDEIGREQDAEALREAARCGVSVVASAHASGLEDAFTRRATGELLRDGTFRYVMILREIGEPAEVRELRRLRPGEGCA